MVHELGVDSCAQPWTVGTENQNIAYIRAHIVKWGSPSGSLYLQVQDSAGNKIKDSDAVTIASLPTTNGSYFHGMIRFTINIGLRAGNTYKIQLKSSGYTYAATAFIGVATDHNGPKYQTADEDMTGFGAPLDMEFWVKRPTTKGDY